MGYAWEDLEPGQFERVVVVVARGLFGAGVQSFATGPDGGRDGRFSGTADAFPSQAVPWSGLTVFQAKHTNAVNAHFSDPEFSSATNSESVLKKEIPRIRQLIANDGMTNYFLVSNRRLGGTTNEEILNHLSRETNLAKSSIHLAGIEFLDDHLHYDRKILDRARISPLDGALIVSSQDLAEVILHFAEVLEATIDPAPAPVVDRIRYTDKNRINGMSQEFADTLLKRYLSLTGDIERFLANPANRDSRELYEATVDDFQLKILAKHDFSKPFDDLFNYLVDLLFNRDAVLARNKRLTRALVFYMYWHCDIGRSSDADSQ